MSDINQRASAFNGSGLDYRRTLKNDYINWELGIKAGAIKSEDNFQRILKVYDLIKKNLETYTSPDSQDNVFESISSDESIVDYNSENTKETNQISEEDKIEQAEQALKYFIGNT